jgi:hypothetical protein
MTDVVIEYERVSALVARASAGNVLDLAASRVGGAAFFEGWVARPKVVAQLLLAVAAVARSRYFRPIPARMLDPILTSGDERLRIESFSSCCGVYARADLLPDGLRDVRVGSGTTNVDLNQDVRDALSRVDDRAELLLSVRNEGLEVVTRETAAFERKVKLPARWIKGLGEAALAQVDMQPVAVLDASAARRLLVGLPAAGSAAAPPYTLVQQGHDWTFRQARARDAAVVAGPYRLRELIPLGPYIEKLTVWTRPGSGARSCAFQLDLPAARMWLLLSPDVAHGFSGEGAALAALSDPAAVAAATELRPMLGWSARLDETSLAERADVPTGRIRDLLAVLGGRGLVGRDVADAAWFRRDLPFAADRVAKLQPRVGGAAAIDDTELRSNPIDGGHEVFVPSRGIAHRVVLIGDESRCTCQWWMRHGSSRGPCRHILAARRLFNQNPANSRPETS